MPFAKQPDLGHKTSRASVGAGWRNNDTFEEVSVRAGYHDLLDPEIGYTPDAQIEIASVSVRHYNRADQTRIERATLANVVSLSPIDSVVSRTFMEDQYRHEHDSVRWLSTLQQRRGKWRHRGGDGIPLAETGSFFCLCRGRGQLQPCLSRRPSHRRRGTVGLLTDLTDQWKLMASGTYLRYAWGISQTTFDGSWVTLYHCLRIWRFGWNITTATTTTMWSSACRHSFSRAQEFVTQFR